MKHDGTDITAGQGEEEEGLEEEQNGRDFTCPSTSLSWSRRTRPSARMGFLCSLDESI